jgi:hypothetical protein
MALSPATLQDLTTELKSLEREKQDIDERIHAINLLLRESHTHQQTLPIPLDEPKSRTTTGSDGLRGMLRGVLAKGALTPGDTIRAVREAGFAAPGKTPLETRVYNELGRMKKDGQVRRDEKGRYELAS